MVNIPLRPDQYTNGQLIEDAFNAPNNSGNQTSPNFNMPLGDITSVITQGSSSIGVAAGAFGIPTGEGPFGSISSFFQDYGTPQITNQGQSTNVTCECPDDSSESDRNSFANSPVNVSDAAGRRVRLRPKPGGADVIYCCSPLLEPIKSTNGMLWPYQPVITYTQDVDYKSMELTHANQDIYAYHRTPSVKLTVDGEFSVQTQKEGLYAMACIHYLRTVTKMYFGEDAPGNRAIGTPPPVLLFDAYGSYMFNALPVIVTAFAVGLPKDVDYVPVDMTGMTEMLSTTGKWDSLTNPYFRDTQNNEIVWLPSLFNIQVQLIVQNTPTRLRKFNLGSFRNGSLVRKGGWI